MFDKRLAAVHHARVALRLGIGTFAAAACAAAVWLLPIGSTFAKPGGINLKLAQGALAVSAPATKALVGHSTNVTITVTDARGTGRGWALRLSAGRAVSVSRIDVQCAAGSSCTLPRSPGLGVTPVVLRAQPDSGMGVMRLVVTLAPLSSGRSVPVTFSVAG